MREVLNPKLSERTTLGLGGTCEVELVAGCEADLPLLSERIGVLGLPVRILGRGSNIFGQDGHHEVVLVRAGFGGGPEEVGAADVLLPEEAAADPERDVRFVRAGAGIALPVLLAYCRKNGLSGLEGLAGIPGSVGGAVAMNAGSFGTETGNRLHEVTVFRAGRIERIVARDCSLAYRHFALPGADGDFLLLSATFALTPASPDGISSCMNQNFLIKKSRQPVAARSAGCVFKNPAGGPSAGVLLDRAGFRGRERGGVSLSAVHANFLVNHGSGTATDALALVESARDAVASRFGISLEYEVRMLPCRLL